MGNEELPRSVGGVAVVHAEPLTGGALQWHWRLDLADGRRLVLRRTRSRVLDSLDRRQEFAFQQLAAAAGVPVALPLAVGPDWLLMEHCPGSSDPSAALDVADPDRLAADLAGALASLHRGGRHSPADAAAQAIARYRAALDQRDRRFLVLEWGLRGLERHAPPTVALVPCHRDFRVGNVLVEKGRLTAVLDWEFAGWSDPHEDLGWFCSRYWRRHRPDRPAGGLTSREAFVAAYAAAGGPAVDLRRLAWWELAANIRWAVIGLVQVDRFFAGDDRSAARALTGCRLAEVEAEILSLGAALHA